MAEPAALGRALDQAGHVGEHELVVAPPHDAEVRLERRERVVGDLGLGRADRGDQRGLARVREADERGVGEQLQLEPQPPLLAVLALLGEARRAARVRRGTARCRGRPGRRAPRASGRRGRTRSASTSSSGAVDHRALGNVDDQVVAAHAVLLLAGAVRARTGLAVRMVAEREQRRDVAVGLQPDVAAPAAVAAVGTATRHVRLPPERDAAGAAVAAFHVALRHVDEAGHPVQDTDRTRRGRRSYDRTMRRRRLASRSLAMLRCVAAAALLEQRLVEGDAHDRDAGVDTSRRRRRPRPLPDLGPASIRAFTGPRSPVQCTAPTSVELHWETPVTATVDLRINGGDVFATYPGGQGDYLVPLTCDGRPQTYELTVHGAGRRHRDEDADAQERLPT